MPNKQRGQAAATSRAHTPLGHGPKAQIWWFGHWQVSFFYRKGFWHLLKKEKKKKAEGKGPRDLRTCLNNGKAAAAGFVYVIKKGHSFEVAHEQPQRWFLKAAEL